MCQQAHKEGFFLRPNVDIESRTEPAFVTASTSCRAAVHLFQKSIFLEQNGSKIEGLSAFWFLSYESVLAKNYHPKIFGFDAAKSGNDFQPKASRGAGIKKANLL